MRPAATAEDKHREARAWLRKVFKGDQVPQYEINDRTIEILYRLSRTCNSRDEDAEVMVADAEQRTLEYQAETRRVAVLLGSVGLSEHSFSQSGAVSLKTLSQLAVDLDLHHPTLGSYMVALSDQAKDILGVADARKGEAASSRALKASTGAGIAQLNVLMRTLEAAAAEEEVLRGRTDMFANETELLEHKGKAYAKSLRESDNVLERVGYEASLSHGALLAQAAELSLLEKEVKPLRREVDAYRDLPPNLLAARVKLEGAKEQLLNVDTQVNRSINQMHA